MANKPIYSQLQALDTANMTIDEIAAAIGAKRLTVQRNLRFHKLPFKKEPGPVMRERAQTVADLYKQGMGVAEIAHVLQIRQDTVVRRLALNGIDTQVESNKIAASAEMLTTVLFLRTQQKTLDEIAAQLGCSKSYIAHILIGEGQVVRLFLPQQVAAFYGDLAQRQEMSVEQAIYAAVAVYFLQNQPPADL